MKRLLSLLCVVSILLSFCGCGGNEEGGAVTLYDKNGTLIAAVTKFDFTDSEVTAPTYRSYIQAALMEAATALSSVYGYNEEKAAKKLFKSNYAVYTAFDPTVHTAAETMYSTYEDAGLALGCAVVDYDGNVRAVFSGGDQSYALAKHPPFSTMKPLSVYMQGIESGLMDWSTQITDKPYKQIADGAGVMQDWPVNPNGSYAYRKISLFECIKQSLNTTAVHGLNAVGVEASISFLQNAFDMDLAYEQKKVADKSADEVIGNLALGYLYTGFTPTQLAGYYQVFGNGGQYVKPHTVVSIVSPDGETVYTNEIKAKQVISEDTAYIMNRLLQGVVTAGGTGKAAKVEGVELVGKTGTGSEDGGNWFVGVTPEYTCAVWHGVLGQQGNFAAELFTKLMANMPKHTVTQFPVCPTAHKGIYCSQSGKLFSSSCSQIQIGYYASAHKPEVCDEH